MKTIVKHLEIFKIWHDRLGHPGLGMIRKVINNSVGHNIKTIDFPRPENFMYPACAIEKLNTRPFYIKLRDE